MPFRVSRPPPKIYPNGRELFPNYFVKRLRLNFHYREQRFEFQEPFDAIQPPTSRVSYERDLLPSCYRSHTPLYYFHHIFIVNDLVPVDRDDLPP